jgi:hypothetical protein
MEFPIGVCIGSLVALIVFGLVDIANPVTYPMMVKAEKTCYSNHGIKDAAKFKNKLVVTCNNGGEFVFTEEDYRNE